MKPLLQRDIPPRAAAVVVALVLLAGVVTGREEPADTQSPQAKGTASASVMNGTATQPTLPDLDLDKLNRPRGEDKIDNLFASKALLAPPPVAVPVAITPEPPAPPPTPTAPPLPFRYFGKWVDEGKVVVFLWKNDEGHSVSAGTTVDGTYQIESITESSVNFIYLPLGSKQTLSITNPE